MKFPFPFKSTSETAARLWPTCVNNPQTLSFRISTGDNLYKITNSAYLDDDSKFGEGNRSSDSFFSACNSGICNYSSDEHPESFESAVIGGLSSDRLFFEPGETNSILEEAKTTIDGCAREDGVAVVAMESADPYSDFRISMEEMVEAEGLKEWEHFEELLACYLRINREINYRYIVEAFLDLLIHLGMVSANEDLLSSTSTSTSSSSIAAPISFTSPLSFSSSSSNYSSTTAPENEGDHRVVRKIGENSSSSSSVSSRV